MKATERAKRLHPGDKLLLATRAVQQYMATIRSRASGTIRQVMYQLAKREFTSREFGRHAIARSRKRRAGLHVIKTHDLIRSS
jgi:transposase